MTERRGRNRRQLQEDINEKTGYCKLEEEALEGNPWNSVWNRLWT